jgi:hypothetical protein
MREGLADSQMTINNRSAFKVEVLSSKVFDTSLKIGYQLNF